MARLAFGTLSSLANAPYVETFPSGICDTNRYTASERDSFFRLGQPPSRTGRQERQFYPFQGPDLSSRGERTWGAWWISEVSGRRAQSRPLEEHTWERSRRRRIRLRPETC